MQGFQNASHSWPSSGRPGCGLRRWPAPLHPSVTHRGSGFPVKPALSPSPPSSAARPASSPPWSVSLLLASQEHVRRGPSIPRALGNTGHAGAQPPSSFCRHLSSAHARSQGVDGGGAGLHLSSEGGRPAPPLPHTQPVWVQPLRALPSEELHLEAARSVPHNLTAPQLAPAQGHPPSLGQTGGPSSLELPGGGQQTRTHSGPNLALGSDPV